MAVRVADNLKTANDSTEFPVAYGSDIWLDKNKGSGTPNYASIQSMLNNDELGNDGSAIQVDLLPHPSVDELGKIYEFIGSTGTYVNGYFYECVSDGEPTPTYSWVQKNVQPSNATATDVSYDNTTSELVATNVQDAIDEIKGGLGTASGKNFTDLVRPNSHELVESGSVYSAINNALSSIYTPRGELTCAELTSSLLIEDNVGNVYTMSDSGTTSALFINGAGLTINIGDNVGIIKASADTYFFNYMGNAFDLTDYQKKDLSSPIAGASTVEGAIAQNTSDIEKIKAYTAVSNTDANTLTTTGLYYLTTGCTNIPSAYCILQVQSKNTTSISDDIAQYTVNTEGEQYYRVRVNGTWSSWQKLATEEYVNKNFIRYGFYQAPDGDSYKRLMIHNSSYLNGKFCCVDRSGNEYVITIKSGTPTSFCKVNDVNSSTECIVGIRFYTEDVRKIHLYIQSKDWNNLTYYFLSDSESKIDEFDSDSTEYNDASPITWQKFATTDNLIRVTENEYQLQVGGDNYAWFDLGTSPNTGNSQAYLFYEITYGRVDGLQSKILVSCGGTMTDGNYFKIINLNNAQTSSAEQFKLDSNKHLWLGMQSYCDAHVKVYGRWTGMGSKTTVEPTGTVLPIYKLVTESDLAIKKKNISATGGATSFSTTIPLSMAQRNTPFYLEVLSVGNNNAIKEMKYLVFVSSINTIVTTKEISKDSNFTNVSITFDASTGYALSFSSTETLYSTTIYIQQ